MRRRYCFAPAAPAAPSKRNGNITQATWATPALGRPNTYNYTYDYLDRLRSASFGHFSTGQEQPPGGPGGPGIPEEGGGGTTSSRVSGPDDAPTYTADNRYNTTYTYDDRGNLETLTRRGLVPDATGQLAPRLIDNLEYAYFERSNRLRQVHDHSTGPDLPNDREIDFPIGAPGTFAARRTVTGSAPVTNPSGQVTFEAGQTITLEPGFHHAGTGGTFLVQTDPTLDRPASQAGFIEGSAEDYAYDANGNLLTDLDKGITRITYTHLNLPERIERGPDRRVLFSSYLPD